MRRLPALLTAAALATVLASSLSACAGAPGFGGCDPVYQPGSASELVTATGSGSSQPDIDFPTPLISKTPQVSTISAGEGDPIPQRGTVDVRITILQGETGAELASTYSDDRLARYVAGGDERAINGALQCATVGERLTLTGPAGDIFGEGAIEGLSDDATLVAVYDVVASYLGAANGFNQLPQDGMPTVVTAPDGQPGITVPDAEAPSEERVSTIKAGGGEKVADGDTAVVHLSAWTWPNPGNPPDDVDTTWASEANPDWASAPVNQIVSEDGPDSGRLPPGVAAKLIGTQVGSQLLVVIPAGDAYPGGVPSGVDQSSTLIYVIDVLGILKQS